MSSVKRGRQDTESREPEPPTRELTLVERRAQVGDGTREPIDRERHPERDTPLPMLLEVVRGAEQLAPLDAADPRPPILGERTGPVRAEIPRVEVVQPERGREASAVSRKGPDVHKVGELVRRIASQDRCLEDLRTMGRKTRESSAQAAQTRVWVNHLTCNRFLRFATR